jgi:hypothetical protein
MAKKDDVYARMRDRVINGPDLADAAAEVVPDDLAPIELRGLVSELDLADEPFTSNRPATVDAFTRHALRTHLIAHAFAEGWVDERAKKHAPILEREERRRRDPAPEAP